MIEKDTIHVNEDAGWSGPRMSILKKEFIKYINARNGVIELSYMNSDHRFEVIYKNLVRTRVIKVKRKTDTCIIVELFRCSVCGKIYRRDLLKNRGPVAGLICNQCKRHERAIKALEGLLPKYSHAGGRPVLTSPQEFNTIEVLSLGGNSVTVSEQTQGTPELDFFGENGVYGVSEIGEALEKMQRLSAAGTLDLFLGLPDRHVEFRRRR